MIKNIEITKLSPHPGNPRKDLGDLTELADSIKKQGILQNLTVVPYIGEVTGEPIEGIYRVVIGHRRLAAAKLAGLTELPCAVAEMTEQEQVATMLLENMQRADLSIYEQAHGFQMMLDFGDTVKGIAEKTGFSETTVKHRVRLNELDPKKLAETMSRNVRIEDYIALEKIKNLKLRNEVLEHIGTNNFNWRFNNAIEQEAMPERREKLLQFLESWAQRIKKAPKNPYDYMKCFHGYKMDDYKKPKDADKGGYTFFDSGTDIKLYKKEDKSEKTQVSATEKAFKECEAKIKGLTKQAYELRREFVLNFGGGKTKAKEVMDFTMIRLVRYGGEDPDKLLALLGIDPPAEEEGQSWTKKVANRRNLIMQKYLRQPERTMLAVAWATTENDEKYYEAQSWNKVIKHAPNDTLDAIYDGLIALGYEMSDEERALRDGTHELFQSSE